MSVHLRFMASAERGQIKQGDFDQFDTLGDDPSAHRWRAWWRASLADGLIDHIVLEAYPVIRATPQGAWIDQCACLIGSDWQLSGAKKWVADGSSMSFAKLTRESALHSLRTRLMRWQMNHRKDMRRLLTASRLAADLWPESADAIAAGVDALKDEFDDGDKK